MSENKQFTIKRPCKTYPHTIGLYYRILEIIGHTNKVKFNLEWQNKLKLVYFILFHWFAASSCLSHLISTFTRSIRFVDEFLHRLFEDFAFNLFYFDCNIFIFRYDEVQAMVKYMETSFSMSNEKIVQKCNKKGKTTLLLFLIIGAVATSGSILETFFRSTEEEMDMIRYVYHRKHPERLLQTNFYVPFVDDSESPYYEIIWITELLMISLVNFAIGVSGSFVPTLVNHIEGQYEILCSYVENLGRIHLDEDENRIIYTDIVNNQILRINDEKKFGGNFKVFRYKGKCTLDPKIEELYQQDYCQKIVKFHQVLIHFQEKMTSLQYPYMIIKVFFFNIMFALCLYQLCTDRSPGISQTRVYRVVGEFVGIAAIFFYLCHCSERLDDCNRKLHRACIGCDWWRLSPQVRRTLLMITRIAQKPNHFRLAYRAQVLDYAFFVSMAKFSYSFVNFMRFRAKP